MSAAVGMTATPLRDRLHGWRDRLLADSRFRRLVTRLPLLRGVGRRRARELFDLCAGFVYSQTLLACVRLRVMERLAERPRTPAELAAELDLPESATAQLLAAAAALRLAERRSGGRYGLGDLGAVLAGMPALSAMVEHHAVLYDDLRDPVALLRAPRGTAGLAGYWPYAGHDAPDDLNAESVGPYSRLMAASQPLVAEEVLDAVPLRRYRRVMDVGGGEGSFLLRAAERWPHITGVVVDLPAVAERAMTRIRQAGLDDRLSARGVDFLRDPLPDDADLITLVRVVHDHDDEQALALLRAVHRALPVGGVVVVAEPMAGTPGFEAMGDAYFGFYLLAMGRGRPRTPVAMQALLERAGFSAVRLRRARDPLQARVVTGRRDTASVTNS